MNTIILFLALWGLAPSAPIDPRTLPAQIPCRTPPEFYICDAKCEKAFVACFWKCVPKTGDEAQCDADCNGPGIKCKQKCHDKRWKICVAEWWKLSCKERCQAYYEDSRNDCPDYKHENCAAQWDAAQRECEALCPERPEK